MQNGAVALEEVYVGQPPLGVAVGGPGVAKVDIDEVHFAAPEVVGQPGRVPVHKKDVGQPQLHHPLHGDHHGVGHPLHRNKEDVRVLLRRLGGEAALAAAQLQPQLRRVRLQLPPAAAVRFRIPDEAGLAALHPGNQVGLFPHSHSFAPRLKIVSIIPYTHLLCKEHLQFPAIYHILGKPLSGRAPPGKYPGIAKLVSRLVWECRAAIRGGQG